jgi:hypothetical protein
MDRSASANSAACCPRPSPAASHRDSEWGPRRRRAAASIRSRGHGGDGDDGDLPGRCLPRQPPWFLRPRWCFPAPSPLSLSLAPPPPGRSTIVSRSSISHSPREPTTREDAAGVAGNCWKPAAPFVSLFCSKELICRCGSARLLETV